MIKVNEKQLIPNQIRASLPQALFFDIESHCIKIGKSPEEIRLRVNCESEIVISGTSVFVGKKLSEGEISEIFYKLCGGSIYAHADTICKGFISGEKGIRIGVCGRAVVRGGAVSAVHDISSLNIRLPSASLPDVSFIAPKFLSSNGGMLIFSKPGEGKTTVLRALIRELCGKYKRRGAVIDTRDELYITSSGENLHTDVLRGYPRGEVIELAVRSMNPEIIFCDEIGSAEEAKAILRARDSGVVFVATCHGDDVRKLICRNGISEMHEAEIFSSYVKLSRKEEKCSFEFFSHDDI